MEAYRSVRRAYVILFNCHEYFIECGRSYGFKHFIKCNLNSCTFNVVVLP